MMDTSGVEEMVCCVWGEGPHRASSGRGNVTSLQTASRQYPAPVPRDTFLRKRPGGQATAEETAWGTPTTRTIYSLQSTLPNTRTTQTRMTDCRITSPRTYHLFSPGTNQGGLTLYKIHYFKWSKNPEDDAPKLQEVIDEYHKNGYGMLQTLPVGTVGVMLVFFNPNVEYEAARPLSMDPNDIPVEPDSGPNYPPKE